MIPDWLDVLTHHIHSKDPRVSVRSHKYEAFMTCVFCQSRSEILPQHWWGPESGVLWSGLLIDVWVCYMEHTPGRKIWVLRNVPHIRCLWGLENLRAYRCQCNLTCVCRGGILSPKWGRSLFGWWREAGPVCLFVIGWTSILNFMEATSHVSHVVFFLQNKMVCLKGLTQVFSWNIKLVWLAM